MFPAPLPDLDGLDPEALKALLIAKHNESVEQHKQLRSSSQEIEHLKLVIEKYRRMIFGRKSEKLTRELEQLELRLEELETAQAADQAAEAAAEAEQPSSPQSDSKPRTSRPRRRPLPEDLPREVIMHMPELESCPCCGGPRTLKARALGFDAKGLDRLDDIGVEVRTSIKDQVFRCRVERKCLAQLLRRPRTCGMFRYIEVADAAAVMGDHEEAIQNPEREGWHREEVHRGNRLTLVAEKRAQRVAGSSSRGAFRIHRRTVRSEMS